MNNDTVTQLSDWTKRVEKQEEKWSLLRPQLFEEMLTYLTLPTQPVRNTFMAIDHSEHSELYQLPQHTIMHNVMYRFVLIVVTKELFGVCNVDQQYYSALNVTPHFIK